MTTWPSPFLSIRYECPFLQTPVGCPETEGSLREKPWPLPSSWAVPSHCTNCDSRVWQLSQRPGFQPVWRQCSVAKLYLTLCDPMDCSPSGSSVHGILQARILQRVTISSRDLPNARIEPLSPAWQADPLPLHQLVCQFIQHLLNK